MTAREDDRVATGATLSHFRITGRLGEGGMGVVYRAHDTELGRDVALKLLPAGVVSDGARQALIEEARTASRLQHPNLCTVYEVGQAGDQVFVAMELVEGRTLRETIPPAGLPEETVVRYAAPLARALAHAHARHVVHRDLKSSNVVVDPSGQPKLLDFGLSRRLIEELPDPAGVSRTSTGVVVGTPESLAPELLQGGRANAASDVWAFGVVLYEMCAGHVPFAGGNVGAVVTSILHAVPAPLPATVSPGLAQVVSRCLAKDPALRYRTADEVAAALEALLPGAARPMALPARRPAWLRIASFALVLLLLLIAAVWIGDPWGLRSRLSGGHAIRSIAVLPLESLPPEPDQAYFADGMTEQLIGDLAQIRDLRVISRTSVQPFQGARKGLAEIARALDVDAVVEGSVQRDGDVVRIQLRLMDARTERPLWAGSFDRSRRNVLALQSEVAREVTEHIRAHLTESQTRHLAKSREVDPAAFEVGSSRVDLQACKLEYSIVSPK